jgi:hypothetical protein
LWLLLGCFSAPAQEKWSFDVTPYLWIAIPDVETSLPNVARTASSPGVSPSVARTAPSGIDRHYDTRISAGAMIAAQAHYGPMGLLVDFAWLRLDTEALNPGPSFSAGNLNSDFIYTTAAVGYSLPLSGKFHAEIVAGARLWNVSEDLELQSGEQPGFQASVDRTWVDPMVGADLRYDLSKKWFVGAKGLVGGFGVSADMAYEVFAGVGYHFTDWCSATIGYRYLYRNIATTGSPEAELRVPVGLWLPFLKNTTPRKLDRVAGLNQFMESTTESRPHSVWPLRLLCRWAGRDQARFQARPQARGRGGESGIIARWNHAQRAANDLQTRRTIGRD